MVVPLSVGILAHLQRGQMPLPVQLLACHTLKRVDERPPGEKRVS
jgi:hypothetical protein